MRKMFENWMLNTQGIEDVKELSTKEFDEYYQMFIKENSLD